MIFTVLVLVFFILLLTAIGFILVMTGLEFFADADRWWGWQERIAGLVLFLLGLASFAGAATIFITSEWP